jgi:hypothetical protein
LCCFFSLRHRYAYEDKDPQCMPPPPTHTHIKAFCDLQWRKLNMNILIIFETSLITVDKIQIISGVQTRGKGMLCCSPTKSKFKKKLQILYTR